MDARLTALFTQGLAALDAGDLGTAERLLLAVVEQDGAAPGAWHALGMVALRSGSVEIGVERAKRAVALDRKNPAYLNSLGIAYSEKGDFAAATHAFRRALRIKPAFAEAHYNLAKVLRKEGKLAESLVEYERAHALNPWAVPAQLGLAMIHRLLGRPDSALAVLRAAARAGPPHADLIPYLAECLADVEGPQAAVAWLQELLARDPDSQQAHHILGLLLLSLGHWREGWSHHLWRAHGARERAQARPEILPARLDGKRVFVRAEEGIGDVLFYLRFASELCERGATIALECPPPFAKLAPLVGDRVPIDEPAATDVRVWIADLPALLRTQATPPPFPLRAEPDRSARAQANLTQLGAPPYLGLTWRAGTDERRARDLGADRAGLRLVAKEISPVLLGRAVRGWPGTLVSLQRGLVPAELDEISGAAGAKIHDLAAATDDLRDALALLEQLDEHVAVLNTNMHLLAGLGRTARVLVPRPLDWRWMREGDPVWFPGFRVYRQPADLSWSQPLTQLRQDLEESRKRLAA